jgi:putative N6-adenine-specific DNA methylase
LVSSVQGFGFLRLKPFLQTKEKQFWDLILQMANAQMKLHANDELQIAGSDINEKMVAICKGNWQKAGLPGLPIVRQVDALVAKSPFKTGSGVMLFNPPYGERIELKGGRGDEEAQKMSRGARDPLPKNISNPEFIAFLEQFGRHLKEDFGGWQVDVLTADMGLPGQLRMKESKRTPLFNGAIECRLFRFDIRAMTSS